MKFAGKKEEFTELVDGLGFDGEWSDDGNKLCFRHSKRAVVNFYPTTGTVQIQGKLNHRIAT